ncbi:MAG: hypothetical protein M5U21_11840 [Fimbriimonadaceae bacterium]|nr:hypothetical protein [Fimbriimonadaceae bacterium]
MIVQSGDIQLKSAGMIVKSGGFQVKSAAMIVKIVKKMVKNAALHLPPGARSLKGRHSKGRIK